MKKIIRAYYENGSATQDPTEIKNLLATGQDVELDIDSGTKRGVIISTSHSLKGETVKVGTEEITI